MEIIKFIAAYIVCGMLFAVICVPHAKGTDVERVLVSSVAGLFWPLIVGALMFAYPACKYLDYINAKKGAK